MRLALFAPECALNCEPPVRFCCEIGTKVTWDGSWQQDKLQQRHLASKKILSQNGRASGRGRVCTQLRAASQGLLRNRHEGHLGRFVAAGQASATTSCLQENSEGPCASRCLLQSVHSTASRQSGFAAKSARRSPGTVRGSRTSFSNDILSRRKF